MGEKLSANYMQIKLVRINSVRFEKLLRSFLCKVQVGSFKQEREV